MKARLTGSKSNNRYSKGSVTLEILLAFTVFIMCITAVIMLFFENQSVVVDSQTNNEALYKAGKMLEEARALSRKNYLGVVSTTSIETVGGLSYTKVLSVIDLTQCKKQVTSTIDWATTTPRSQKIELTTYLTDIPGALALGGDCVDVPPDLKWDNPQRFARDTINPGKPTVMDVLNKIAYFGADAAPFFYIADTNGAYYDPNNNQALFITFSNSFTLVARPNALDVMHDPVSNNNFVFTAMNTTKKQLNVINVTDMYNPVLVASSTLKNTSGSFPQGWRISYYKNRLYVVNRETTGAEFHIFDVSNPANPIELGNGTALNITIESISIQERIIGTVTKRFAYLATDQNSGELKVYDVTDPTNSGIISEIIVARQDLTGSQDGASVFAIGNKLYFGRQSSTGADLYVFDITNPPAGLTLLGSEDIGTSVLQVYVVGTYGFLATPKVSKEFQVWNIADLSNITLVKEFNFGNIVDEGIDYEPNFIYATGQSTPNFQILYNP